MRAVEAAEEHAAACVSQEEAYRAAAEEGGDGAAERWALALAQRDEAESKLAAALTKKERARKYDEMFESVDKLTTTDSHALRQREPSSALNHWRG